MSFDIETKKNIDIQYFLKKIEEHPLKNDIINMFMKGPPPNKGFMWCESSGGPDCHWTLEEAQGLKFIERLVLDKGWDSSGYGFMMRFIQSRIEEKYKDILNPEVNDLLSEPKVPTTHRESYIDTVFNYIQHK